MNITFTNVWDHEIDKPQSAAKHMPSWYTNMESYIGGIKKTNGSGASLGTIKRCMPVFDAISAGYIITLPADVYISVLEYEPQDKETGKVIEDLPIKKEQKFEWSSPSTQIGFHPVEQALTHPLKNEYNYPKWVNPWSIKTPKGYSTLFVQPMHRESIFTIMPGIVDTDKYYAPVNFPFTTNDPNFEGLIPKGTPIAQVIPFKRDSWKIKFGGDKELIEQKNIEIKIQSRFFDRYKSMFRSNKNYV
jgi:hypothetical protein